VKAFIVIGLKEELELLILSSFWQHKPKKILQKN
jgi:hypothetical protein